MSSINMYMWGLYLYSNRASDATNITNWSCEISLKDASHGKQYSNDDESKARTLNDFFTSVTHVDDENTVFPVMTPLSDARLDTITVTVDGVNEAI